MEIENIYVFAQLKGEPNKMHQVLIKKENGNILQHFVNGLEGSIKLDKQTFSIEVNNGK